VKNHPHVRECDVRASDNHMKCICSEDVDPDEM